MGKKIAVIGAGIYGISIALELSKQYNVDLYEKSHNILTAASGINQFRLHRGYHYPRSTETILSSKIAEPLFKKYYSEAILENTKNFYCIAKEKSLISAEEYRLICKIHGLSYTETDLFLVNKNAISFIAEVEECLIDPKALYKTCKERLKKSSVSLHLNKKADKNIYSDYDYVVIATYANINSLLTKKHQKNYQYELCEKIVVALPDKFSNISIVIMDGPFMCVDPYGKTGLFLMGNVVHAIHQTNIGRYPRIDKKFFSLLNRGIIKNPPITNFDLFIDSAKKFIPDIVKAKHIGSLYTIRTLMPYKEKTDERLTIVERINNKIFTVLGGKISNCIETAKKVRQMISNE